MPPQGERSRPTPTRWRDHDSENDAACDPASDDADHDRVAQVKLAAEVEVECDDTEAEGTERRGDAAGATVQVQKDLMPAQLGLG